ncbi:MAG: DUF3347 domain-containing protein [Deltaproteobacteria bacterium]|nr:MAG: DUF3347 domain-containing protein [Deltaproteobacteria bacterium]
MMRWMWIVALGLAAGACSKDEPAKPSAPAAAKPDEPAAAKPAEPAAAKPAEPAAAKPAEPAAAEPTGPIDAVFAAYERCRAALASDDAEVKECAADMAKLAADAASNATDAAKAPLGALAKAAEQLGAAADLDAARRAFAEVSRAAIDAVAALPKMAEKLHAFECPMAKEFGFNRWLQPTAKLENPYMGKKMLDCGMEVHDLHGGTPGMGHDMKGGEADKN